MGQKLFNFEDNIGLVVLKRNVLENNEPLFVKEFFSNLHQLEWSYWDKMIES